MSIWVYPLQAKGYRVGLVLQQQAEQNNFRRAPAGWFAFLDASWLRFVPRLTQARVLLTKSVNDVEKTRYVDCRGKSYEVRGCTRRSLMRDYDPVNTGVRCPLG
jgi:hypothetical protein